MTVKDGNADGETSSAFIDPSNLQLPDKEQEVTVVASDIHSSDNKSVELSLSRLKKEDQRNDSQLLSPDFGELREEIKEDDNFSPSSKQNTMRHMSKDEHETRENGSSSQNSSTTFINNVSGDLGVKSSNRSNSNLQINEQNNRSDSSYSNLQINEQNKRFDAYNNNQYQQINGNYFSSNPNSVFLSQNEQKDGNINAGDQVNKHSEFGLHNNFIHGNPVLPSQLNSSDRFISAWNHAPFAPVFPNEAAYSFENMGVKASGDASEPQKVIHIPIPIAVPIFMPQNGSNFSQQNIFQKYMQLNEYNKMTPGAPLNKAQMEYLATQHHMLQLHNSDHQARTLFSSLSTHNLETLNDSSKSSTTNIQQDTPATITTALATGNCKEALRSSQKLPKLKFETPKSSVSSVNINNTFSAGTENNSPSNSISSFNHYSVERLKSEAEKNSPTSNSLGPQVRSPISDHNLLSELAIESLQRQRNQSKLIHLDPVPNFEDQKDVKLWLQKIFYPLGIEIAIERSDKSKITFKCKALKRADDDLQTDYSAKNAAIAEFKNDEEMTKKKRVKSPFNTCPFRIRASFRAKREKWQIVIVNNTHSHQLKFNPTSINYKQFKQTLREINDVETIKKFDELEYKSKMNLPMQVDTIPCDCGLTEEVQSFGVVLPTSLTSGKQQTSVLGRFSQKNTARKSSAAGMQSDDAKSTSASSGVVKNKRQQPKNSRMLYSLQKHVNLTNKSPLDEAKASSEEHCLNEDIQFDDFSQQVSKVESFFEGQKMANIQSVLDLDGSAAVSDQFSNFPKSNTNNILDFDIGGDEVDFTSFFLNPHKRPSNTSPESEPFNRIFAKNENLDLNILTESQKNADIGGPVKNDGLLKELDDMHLFEDSKDSSYFFETI